MRPHQQSVGGMCMAIVAWGEVNMCSSGRNAGSRDAMTIGGQARVCKAVRLVAHRDLRYVEGRGPFRLFVCINFSP